MTDDLRRTYTDRIAQGTPNSVQRVTANIALDQAVQTTRIAVVLEAILHEIRIANNQNLD